MLSNSAEVACPESLVSLSLDQLKKHRAGLRILEDGGRLAHENLEQVVRR